MLRKGTKSLFLVLGLRSFNIYIKLLFMYNMYLLACMHIPLMEFNLENLWQYLLEAVSCLICEYPQKRLKRKKKLS